MLLLLGRPCLSAFLVFICIDASVATVFAWTLDRLGLVDIICRLCAFDCLVIFHVVEVSCFMGLGLRSRGGDRRDRSENTSRERPEKLFDLCTGRPRTQPKQRQRGRTCSPLKNLRSGSRVVAVVVVCVVSSTSNIKRKARPVRGSVSPPSNALCVRTWYGIITYCASAGIGAWSTLIALLLTMGRYASE